MAMKRGITRRAMLPLAAVLLVAPSACTYVGHGQPQRDYVYDYYYYPSVDIYFHLYSGYYYYRDGRTWRRVRTLPDRYYLDYHDRRRLVIRDGEPYAHHDEHRRNYRPPADLRHQPERNRDERQRNNREHDEYRKRYGPG